MEQHQACRQRHEAVGSIWQRALASTARVIMLADVAAFSAPTPVAASATSRSARDSGAADSMQRPLSGERRSAAEPPLRESAVFYFPNGPPASHKTAGSSLQRVRAQARKNAPGSSSKAKTAIKQERGLALSSFAKDCLAAGDNPLLKMKRREAIKAAAQGSKHERAKRPCNELRGAERVAPAAGSAPPAAG